MNDRQTTVRTIAKRLLDGEDVTVFSPVFAACDAFAEDIFRALNRCVVCVVRDLPPVSPQGTTGRTRAFFADRSMPDTAIASLLHTAQRETAPYIFYITPGLLLHDMLPLFLSRAKPAALFVTEAESASPLLYYFNKKLSNVCELRAHLNRRVPLCLFCASDSSLLLRDVYHTLGTLRPALFYPGVPNPRTTLYTGDGTPLFALLEAYMRTNQIKNALVHCTNHDEAHRGIGYFRFFAYRGECLLGSHPYADKKRITERFLRGKTDVLFTTAFTHAVYKTDLELTAYLGMPSDLYQLLRSAYPAGRHIAVFSNRQDVTENLFHLNDYREMRAQHSLLAQQRLLEERISNLRRCARALGDGKTAYEALREQYPYIYYE